MTKLKAELNEQQVTSARLRKLCFKRFFGDIL
jgi:hypothetical protein